MGNGAGGAKKWCLKVVDELGGSWAGRGMSWLDGDPDLAMSVDCGGVGASNERLRLRGGRGMVERRDREMMSQVQMGEVS